MNGPLDAAPASASDGPPPSAPGGGDTSRSCLEVTLRHISDAVIVSDGQGLVTLMNPLAEALTGWSGFEASGQRLAHVFPVVGTVTGEPLCLAPTRPDEGTPDWTAVQLIDRQGKRHAVSVRSVSSGQVIYNGVTGPVVQRETPCGAVVIGANTNEEGDYED